MQFDNVIDCLVQRGFVDQMTSSQLREFLSEPRKVYVGFDPTADSLHLGNLVGIIGLEWFRKFGHTPYILIGGATGRIGDPSGKNKERPALDDDFLESNVLSLKEFFQKIFTRLNAKPTILNNEEWFGGMSLIHFLKELGKKFRIGPMLAKDSVRIRLESEEGLSFTEFSYQVLQGYDFAYLHTHYGITIQMGGTDQWGNITAGLEYNRKMGSATIYGLTFPLLTRTDGKKFGKTEEGAIWLSEEKLSPYRFYQHLLQTPDADVISLLRMLTFLDIDEIYQIEKQMQKEPTSANQAQRILAEEVTRFVHGDKGLEAALRVTEGMHPGSEAKLDKDILKALLLDMPHIELGEERVVGCKITDLLLLSSFVSSKAEAVRLIRNGGVYLNNKRIDDSTYKILHSDLLENIYLLLSVGKKKKFLIQVV